jgi:hypothetical protein
MKGIYRIYSGDELIAEVPNIITTMGRAHFARVLIGEQTKAAEYMSFGIGSHPTVTAGIETLHFEYVRSNVELSDAVDSPPTGQIVMRARIPDNRVLQIHEIGLVMRDSFSDDGFPSSLITTFDEGEEEVWTGYDLNSTDNRTGTSSMALSVNASQTKTITRTEPFGQFEDLANNDTFALAYNSVTGVPATIRIRFLVDASNYRQYQFTPSAGFNVRRWAKSDFTQTGTAPWDGFRTMEIAVIGGGAGSTVVFEGMRVDLAPSIERDFLVSYSKLFEPIRKEGLADLQIEYKIDLVFTETT